MHEPLSDKIMHTQREAAAERGPEGPVEREVRLAATESRETVIRERIAGGFYNTPAVADVVARRILKRKDL